MAERTMEDFAAYKVAHLIFLVLSPTLMVLGCIGNTISFLVFYPKAKAHKDKSAHFYLALLGIADSVSLVASIIPGFIRHAANVDVYYETGCGWYLFMLYTVTDISIYILVCMTTERFITVYFPYKASTLCTRKRAAITVTFVCILLISINIHLAFTTKSDSDIVILSDNTTLVIQFCTDTDDHIFWKKFIWPWVDISVLSIIPFVFFVSLNGSVIIRMSNFARKVHSEGSGVPEQRSIRQRKMNYLVALICVVFLMTTFPITILHIVEPYWHRETPEQKAAHSLVQAFLGHLGYLTNCVNFLLYYYRGSNFKEDLKNVIRNRSKIPTVTQAVQ